MYVLGDMNRLHIQLSCDLGSSNEGTCDILVKIIIAGPYMDVNSSKFPNMNLRYF